MGKRRGKRSEGTRIREVGKDSRKGDTVGNNSFRRTGKERTRKERENGEKETQTATETETETDTPRISCY